MALANVQPFIDQVNATDGVLESVLVYIDGVKARQDAAVAEAMALGATAEELKPLTDEFAQQAALRDKVAAAITANP